MLSLMSELQARRSRDEGASFEGPIVKGRPHDGCFASDAEALLARGTFCRLHRVFDYAAPPTMTSGLFSAAVTAVVATVAAHAEAT